MAVGRAQEIAKTFNAFRSTHRMTALQLLGAIQSMLCVTGLMQEAEAEQVEAAKQGTA